MSGPTRREVIVGLAAAALLPACRCGVDDPAARALGAGAAWLWAQQAGDGSFPSRTYGLLREGHSLTPFALDALLRVPEAAHSPDPIAVSRALAWMLQARRSGALGLAPRAPDYPVYATSLMLGCLAAVAPPGWVEAAAPSVGWLVGQQLRAELGWADHVGEGGFPMGTAAPLAPPVAGHVDLSMTRRALEALRRCEGVPDEVFAAGRRFALRCRTADGGFLYSPVEGGLNKGEPGEDGISLGYGSATADGILALLACGADPADAAIEAARARLLAMHTWARNPGIGGGPMAGFADAMRGYWWAAGARAYRAVGGPAGWREGLIDAVLAAQRPDGSWANPSPLQKEDDPILATALSVSALADALVA